MPRKYIYRCPGIEKIHGIDCETKVVDSGEFPDGWADSPQAAKELVGKPVSEQETQTTKEFTTQELYDLFLVHKNWKKITELTGVARPWLKVRPFAEKEGLELPEAE